MINWKSPANMIGTYILPFHNSMVVSPPGRVKPGQGTLILVPSIMRSGTHLLIDTILNNFSAYRRRPLYVDLDRLLDEPDGRDERVEQLLGAGAYVVKTHYPQVYCHPDREPFVLRVARQSNIITVNRKFEQTFRSSSSWGHPIAEDKDIYRESILRFRRFWSEEPMLEVSFPELTIPLHQKATIENISGYINVGLSDSKPVVVTIPKNKRLKVYIAKLLTRLFGNYSPVINTTIRYASD
ncbi:MAG: hypothetical protein GXP53_06720 [Deltaproteobacteria bacterium]|nr:hypothetical protein [Deltaproteobacteria bacterium]